MNTKLLEEKLDHCRSELNFIAGELLKIRQEKSFPRNRFTTLDTVLIWLTDYHYETCQILEIALNKDEPWYYLRRIKSTLIGESNFVSKSWFPESKIYKNTCELKQYLKNRIDKLVAVD